MNHEYLLSQIANKCGGEVIVNRWVEMDLGKVKLVGKMDILLLNDILVTIEVKSGKEGESHHGQLFLYILSFNSEVEGVLRYDQSMWFY